VTLEGAEISFANPMDKRALSRPINTAIHISCHSMKVTFVKLFLPMLVVILSGAGERTFAQATVTEPSKEGRKSASGSNKPLPSDPEERFKALFTNATLSGRWARLKDGVLGEERTGDKYTIVSVVKRDGENWTVNAKMKYGEKELILPVPVRMKFTADTAVLLVEDLGMPGGGTYTARLLIFERTYSGTWKDQRGGGMLYGTIANQAE
jgi:hypothetical protein